MCEFWDTYDRFRVLENDQRESEVLLAQADQVVCKQRLGSAFAVSLTAVQEWHHPLDGIFLVALRIRL